jgi:monovalent cation:proton antiporter-2 (CPA2) family protein
MHSDGFFFQAFVYLMAAVISVPIAKRLGLGSVLGYLLAGAAIGPFGLELVGEEGQDVMHFAEFGVVMMLFLVGLELQPALLWRLRGPILGLGGLQVSATALLGTGVGVGLGLDWKMALACGLTLSLSSTAIVLQSLNEKGLMKTQGGQGCFAVLLFQDIAVIPMLALMPLLAFAAPAAVEAHGIDALPAWQRTLAVFALIGAIVVGGKLLIRPAFRFIASTGLREVFTAAALLLVIGIALAMQTVGLSPALGTFLAGVVLADSEYRHELESDIEPFKGLLLGLFFIAVGASIDFALVAGMPATVASLVAILIGVKFVVLHILGRVFRLPTSQNFLFSFSLAQGGEFCFVLFSFAAQNSVLPPEVCDPLVAVVALSMAFTPLLMIINDRLVQPRFATPKTQRQADAIDEENPVIVAGFGRFGNVVGRLLKANGIGTTVLDLDPEQIDTLRRFGLKVFYGDAGRMDLLHAAGIEQAKVFVLAIDEPEKANEIATAIKKHHPHLKILARTDSLQHAYEMMHIGADQVFRETFDTAVSLGVETLRQLGFRSFQAHRAGRTFKAHERQSMHQLFDLWDKDNEDYMEAARERAGQLDSLMQNDERDLGHATDHAWEAAAPEDNDKPKDDPPKT